MADAKPGSESAPSGTPEKGPVKGPAKGEGKPKKVYKLRPRKGVKPEEKKPEQGSILDLLKDSLTDAEIGRTEDKDLPALKERFKVEDEKSANWAAGKIALWMAEITRRKASAAEYVADAQRTLERLEYLFKGQLEIWARQNLPHGKKSIKLPAATLKFSPTPEKLDITDEEKLKTWATINCEDALEVETTVSKQVLADWWEKNRTTEEPPKGVEVVPPGENFNIKP